MPSERSTLILGAQRMETPTPELILSIKEMSLYFDAVKVATAKKFWSVVELQIQASVSELIFSIFQSKESA
jgi:hypothetical protein